MESQNVVMIGIIGAVLLMMNMRNPYVGRKTPQQIDALYPDAARIRRETRALYR